MSVPLIHLDDFYEGMPLRWRWIPGCDVYRQHVAKGYVAPYGTAESVDGEWYIRAEDDPEMLFNAKELHEAGYRFFPANGILVRSREVSDLVNRLQGTYVITVADGAGPLNGSLTFTRKFETAPIQHDAAHYITLLEGLLFDAALDLRDVLAEHQANVPEEELRERLEGLKGVFSLLGLEWYEHKIFEKFRTNDPKP